MIPAIVARGYSRGFAAALLAVAGTIALLMPLSIPLTANLAIALYTPPVGGTLFVATKLARVGIGEITRHLWPLMAATFSVVLLITYLPALSTWLPRLLFR